MTRGAGAWWVARPKINRADALACVGCSAFGGRSACCPLPRCDFHHAEHRILCVAATRQTRATLRPSGSSLLIVEDEPLIVIDIQIAFADTCAELTTTSALEHALILVEEDGVSPAILDHAIGDKNSASLYDSKSAAFRSSSIVITMCRIRTGEGHPRLEAGII